MKPNKKYYIILLSTIPIIFFSILFFINKNSLNKNSKIYPGWSGWKKTNCYEGLKYRTRIISKNNHDCKIQIAFKNHYSDKINVFFCVSEYWVAEEQVCEQSVEIEPSKSINGGEWDLINCCHDDICRFKVWICEENSTFTTKIKRQDSTMTLPCDRKIRN